MSTLFLSLPPDSGEHSGFFFLGFSGFLKPIACSLTLFTFSASFLLHLKYVKEICFVLEPDCVLLLLATSPCLVRSLNCLMLVMGLSMGLSPPRSRDYMITEKAFISASPGSTTMNDPATTWKHLLWTLSKTICKLSEANEAEKKNVFWIMPTSFWKTCPGRHKHICLFRDAAEASLGNRGLGKFKFSNLCWRRKWPQIIPVPIGFNRPINGCLMRTLGYCYIRFPKGELTLFCWKAAKSLKHRPSKHDKKGNSDLAGNCSF